MKTIPHKIPSWLPGVFYLGLFVLLVGVHLRLSPYAFDDAFIHFRIARNLLDTGSPYYNPGEPVKVSSSSGWTVAVALLLAAARLAGSAAHLPLWVSAANALFTWGGMLVYTRIVEILAGKRLPFSRKIGFQIAYLAVLLPASLGLMETPLALLAAGCGIYLLLRARPAGFALLGFAACLRIELLALLALLICVTLLRRQFRPAAILGSAALGLVPFLAYDLYFFSTWIPHSVAAKSVVYTIPWYQSALQIVFYSLPVQPANNTFAYLAVSLVFLGLALLTGLMAWRERKTLQSDWPLVFSLWSLAVMGSYIYGRALLFEWYIPLYMVPLLTAGFSLALTIQSPRNVIVKSLVYVVFFASAVFGLRTLYAGLANPAAYSLFDTNARVRVYREAGRRLYDAYPGATLMTSEIGGLGYAFPGRILDAAGLASPAALEFHPLPVPAARAHGALGAIPPGFVAAARPELIVSYDNFAQALLQHEIVQAYNTVQMPALLPEDERLSPGAGVFGDQTLRIYVRKDLPLRPEVSGSR